MVGATTSEVVADAQVQQLDEKDAYDVLETRYRAVVKLHVTAQKPDWLNPWQKRTAERSIGSGVLIRRAGEAHAGEGVATPTLPGETESVQEEELDAGEEEAWEGDAYDEWVDVGHGGWSGVTAAMS